MIRFWFLRTEFRVHVLTFIAAMLAAVLGMGSELPYIAAAVGLHELMHLIAARLCRIEIDYIEIMWFGGAAHVKDIYSAGRSGIIATALAGPAANLILVIIASALAWWEYIGFTMASRMIRINLMLMLFNMMPVMPLDGGRVFYALVSKWLGPSNAMRISVGLAWLLAAVLAIIALIGWRATGIFNITFALMAVFLVSSSLNELHAFERGRPGRTLTALCSEVQLPARADLVAYPHDMPASSAAAFIKPDRLTVFAMTDDGRISAFVTGEEMARRILNET